MKRIVLKILLCVATVWAGVSCGNDSRQTEEKGNSDVAGVASSGKAMHIPAERIGRLAEVFNDSNHAQLPHAKRLGIDPIYNLKDAYFTKRPIVEVVTNDYYFVDTLTHSVPYLVPEAEALISDIGKAFVDSISARGLKGYRIRVTSLLRTASSVKKLRRVNGNATENSTHQYATTFDIAYNRFDCRDTTQYVDQERLKNILGAVLADKRAEGRCLVKYERKSPCFHITTVR